MTFRLSRLLAGSLLLALTQAAHANAVLDWNAITLQTVLTGASATPPRAGPPTTGDVAKVHAAIHDAVQAFEQRYEPYHAHISGAAGSPSAAVAQAARDVLAALYPAQTSALDASLASYLANNGLPANDPGLAIGAQAAANLLSLRANDGYFPSPPPPPYVGGTGIGEWRPTPSLLPGPPASNSPMAAPWLASARPFVLESPSQFRAKPPPSVTSRLYTRHYREVKALGSLTSAERSAAATDLARFWSDNFSVQWNRALRAIAADQGLDLGETARLFALANIAIADAVITAWDSKLYFSFWRPITAIREGDNDGNPNTAGDLAWQSLINSPNYPDYTSGANNVTGAVTRTLQRFFGTNDMAFQVTSLAPGVVSNTRSYSKFSQAAEEVVDARVLLGIHFRFADTEARRQGTRVADFVFRKVLRPLDD
jgi:hypothetical protein